MSIKSYVIQSIPFQEKTFVNFATEKTDESKYCDQLLHRICELPPAELKEFIDYQCIQVKNPSAWLNKLEELLTENAELFEVPKMKGRFAKLYTLIEAKREKIQSVSQSTFCFNTIQEQAKQIQNIEERIIFLLNIKIDFLQCDHPITNQNGKSFIEKIDLEIERVKILQVFSVDKKIKQDLAHTDSTTIVKLKLNCNLNIFIDIFYQMQNELKEKGKPYLEATTQEIAKLISNNFIDKDNQPISVNTIRTILTPSKSQKRPNNDKKIQINKTF